MQPLRKRCVLARVWVRGWHGHVGWSGRCFRWAVKLIASAVGHGAYQLMPDWCRGRDGDKSESVYALWCIVLSALCDGQRLVTTTAHASSAQCSERTMSPGCRCNATMSSHTDCGYLTHGRSPSSLTPSQWTGATSGTRLWGRPRGGGDFDTVNLRFVDTPPPLPRAWQNFAPEAVLMDDHPSVYCHWHVVFIFTY